MVDEARRGLALARVSAGTPSHTLVQPHCSSFWASDALNSFPAGHLLLPPPGALLASHIVGPLLFQVHLQGAFAGSPFK